VQKPICVACGGSCGGARAASFLSKTVTRPVPGPHQSARVQREDYVALLPEPLVDDSTLSVESAVSTPTTCRWPCWLTLERL